MAVDVKIAEIKACKTREELFSLLEKVTNNEQKYWTEDTYEAILELLNTAMGNPKTYYSGFGEQTTEQIFHANCEMFLEGSWRAAEELKEEKSLHDEKIRLEARRETVVEVLETMKRLDILKEPKNSGSITFTEVEAGLQGSVSIFGFIMISELSKIEGRLKELEAQGA